MKTLLILIIGGVVGYLVGRGRRPLDYARGNPGGLGAVNERAREEKEAGKGKILDMMRTRGEITNDDVQSLLGISDASATRYLDELEAEDKIEHSGTTSDTRYRLKSP